MSKASSQKIPLNPPIVLRVLAILAYVLPPIIFPAPSNPKYHFSTLQIIALSISVLTPWIAAWIFGVAGYSRLLKYAASIKDAQAARPFYLLARGIMVLVWGLIVATLIAVLRSHNPANHGLVVGTTIIVNYIYAFTPLAGFYYIRQAILQLNSAKRPRLALNVATGIVALGLLALAAIYVFLTFTNPNRTVAVDSITPATYYLPDWLVLLTVVVPVVASWTIGVLAVAEMYHYQRVVSGFIYRRFMRTLTYGLITIIISSILLEGLLALGTQRLLGSGLQALLAFLYAFLLVELIGYVLVSHGSKKLTLIETA